MVDIYELEEKLKLKLWEKEPKELYDILCYRWNQFIGIQGDYNTDYLIESGRFTKGVVELFESNHFVDQLKKYYDDWLIFSQKEMIEMSNKMGGLLNNNKKKSEVNLDSIDYNKVVYRGFKNYLYYLTQNIVIDLLEVETFNYCRWLGQNGIKSEWSGKNHNDSMSFSERKFEVKGELNLKKNNEKIKFIIKKDLTIESIKIIHSVRNSKKSIVNKSFTIESFGHLLYKLLDIIKDSNENKKISISD